MMCLLSTAVLFSERYSTQDSNITVLRELATGICAPRIVVALGEAPDVATKRGSVAVVEETEGIEYWPEGTNVGRCCVHAWASTKVWA